jgi:hypothetical protein
MNAGMGRIFGSGHRFRTRFPFYVVNIPVRLAGDSLPCRHRIRRRTFGPGENFV